MDGLSDSEVKDIWDRVSKYVDMGEIKGSDTESIQKTLKDALEASSAPSGKRGSVKTLVKHGFAGRAVKVQKIYERLEPIARENRVKDIKEKTAKEAVKEIKRTIKKEKELPLWESEMLLQSALPNKLTPTSSGRISIRTSKGTKTYSPNNLKIFMGNENKVKRIMFLIEESELLGVCCNEAIC